MSDHKNGLYRKYQVERIDGRPLMGGGAVVLEFGDPNAWPAIKEFADTVRHRGYAKLADDLERELAYQEAER